MLRLADIEREATFTEVEGMQIELSFLHNRVIGWKKTLADPHGRVRNFLIAFLDMEYRTRTSIF